MKSARPKKIIASTQIATSPVTISGIILTAGADAAVIAIYNEADDDKTTAKKVLVVKAAINTTRPINREMYLSEGCYIELVSGTTPDITILVR